jgi:hypothetical protein
MSQDSLRSIMNLINEDNPHSRYLEIGTAAGGTLVEIIKYRNHLEAGKADFIVVDPFNYFANQFEIVLQNLKNNNITKDAVRFFKMTSRESFVNHRKDVVKDGLDFILIDGNHKINYVMRDLCWGTCLNVNGFLLIHDYSEKFPGVYRAVNRFIAKNDNYQVIDITDSLLTLRKNSISNSTEVTGLDLIRSDLWALFYQLKASFLKRRNLLLGY